MEEPIRLLLGAIGDMIPQVAIMVALICLGLACALHARWTRKERREAEEFFEPLWADLPNRRTCWPKIFVG